MSYISWDRIVLLLDLQGPLEILSSTKLMPNNFPDEAEKTYVYFLGPNSSTIGATESTVMTWMGKIEMVASADACTAHMQEVAQE